MSYIRQVSVPRYLYIRNIASFKTSNYYLICSVIIPQAFTNSTILTNIYIYNSINNQTVDTHNSSKYFQLLSFNTCLYFKTVLIYPTF